MRPTDEHVGRPMRLRDLGPRARRLLALITLAALLLRAWHQYGRTPQGDDVGTLAYLKQSYGFLLTHFRDPWLTMNAYLVFAKAIRDAFGPAAVAIPSLLAGTALVPLSAACALRVASPSAAEPVVIPGAIAAAILVAVNPYLVEQSSALRAYPFFECAGVAALTATLDWSARPSRAAGIRAGAWGTAMILLHANGVHLALGLALLALVPMGQALAPASERRAALRTLLVPAGVGAAVALAAYLPLASDMAEYRRGWTDAPPTSVAWFPAALSEYFGEGWRVLPFAVLLLASAASALRRGTPVQALLAVIAVAIAGISFSGMSLFPWATARMASFLLPVLVVVAAAGIAAVVPSRAGRVILVLVTAASGVPRFVELAAEKRDHPWTAVAEAVRPYAAGSGVLLDVDTGPSIRLHELRPLLGDAILARPSLADLVREDASTVRTLAVVNPQDPIATQARQRAFGRIQVIEYGPLPARALAEALAADLERSALEGPSPGRTGHLRVLLELRRALGRPDDDGRLTKAYYECLARTRRQRFMPAQRMLPVER